MIMVLAIVNRNMLILVSIVLSGVRVRVPAPIDEG